MEKESHGFTSRKEWTKLFADYNLMISSLNSSSYDLILSDLPDREWVDRYKQNSARVREAFLLNEAMLDRHIRWFTRTPGRWTREIADPLLSTLFRYFTRVQDQGASYEIADSLLGFYQALEDEAAMMKCYMIRATSYTFLDPIHLDKEIDSDCKKAREIYERFFPELTPEEQSMGLSIYDMEFDHISVCLKLGRTAPELLDKMIDWYQSSVKALETVISLDRGYEFNKVLPDFDFYMGSAALCLSSGECTPQQAEVIYQAAEKRHIECERDPKISQSCRVRSKLVYLMARRLKGLCADREIIGFIRELMEDFAPSLFTGSSYSHRAVEAVEAIQLSTERLLSGGRQEPGLYRSVQELFIKYLSTRPYITFVDYICASYNYCYILTSLPNLKGRRQLLYALLKLTMFRQVQTAMHSIMVGDLAMEILDSMISNMPELLTGQLETATVEDVRSKRKAFQHYLYCGALLHDIGKLLCSSVINSQCHRLGDLEFRVLKYHPVTGGEMLEKVPALSVFRDFALGHQKSCDGSFGYPPDFDNTASPQKIFIDIITICDSLDAATDHLGRNYTTAKDFNTVMDELRAESGTRYSADIVRLLDNDTELRERLRQLLEEGRREVYYNVHKMILAESTIQAEVEKTHEWLYNLGLPPVTD